jgi:glycosyltransferase involved in cell wall biosynthesis
MLSQWKWKRALDHVVAISTAIGETLTDYGLPPSQVSVIHPNLDLEDFDAIPPVNDAELGLGPGFRIFCMSALTREKGVEVLIRAFADHGKRFPDSTLVLAGTGSLESDYRRLLESEGIAGRVKFLGFRPDVLGVLKRMDLLAVPSLSEGFGRAVLYGMAAGKPVVASETGGIVDQIVDGRCGRLVEPGNVAALSAALDEMRADSETAGRIAAAGRERVVSRFTDEHIIGRYLELFDRLTT